MFLIDVVRELLEDIGLVAPRCEHARWRPALTNDGQGRFCADCGELEELSPEMFYAYFGRIPRA